jgi:hypothetical protein
MQFDGATIYKDFTMADLPVSQQHDIDDGNHNFGNTLHEIEIRLRELLTSYGANRLSKSHLVTETQCSVHPRGIHLCDIAASEILTGATAPAPKRFYRSFWRGISRKLLQSAASISSSPELVNDHAPPS